MNSSYENLFESIRATCQQEHWFGPELLGPTYRMHVSGDDPNRFGFVFPPASEEELQETEACLGFPLPPLLRTLYAQVANGGFGPGVGLKGTLNGYGRLGNPYPNDKDTIADQYRWRSHTSTINLKEYAGQWTVYRELLLPYGVWPERLLPICDLGCVQEACVDSHEHMFIVAPIDSNEVYCLVQLSLTLEEWLWRWIKSAIPSLLYILPLPLHIGRACLQKSDTPRLTSLCL
jgi:SMI1 / KNR4 family (SUKH-1)